MKHFRLLLFVPILLCSSCNDTDAKKQTVKQSEKLLCFESTSPNASHATPLYDYLKISTYPDGTIEGMGGGFVMAGSMRWISNIKGTQTGDTLKLKVSYEAENPEYNGYDGPFTTSETWYFDASREHLWRMNCAALKNWMGAKEYHRIEPEEIPQDVISRLKTISFR